MYYFPFQALRSRIPVGLIKPNKAHFFSQLPQDTMLLVLKDGILGTPALNSFPILTHAYNKDYALFQGSIDNIIIAYTAVTWQGNMPNIVVTEE